MPKANEGSVLARPDPSPSEPCGSRNLDRRVARAAVTLLRHDGALLRDSPADVLYVGVDGPLRRHFPGGIVLPHTIEHTAYFEQQIAKAKRPRTIVAAAYNDSQVAVIRKAQQAFPKARLVFVSLASPYLLLDVRTAAVQLCTYGARDPEQQAALDVLLGHATASGRLPIAVTGLYPRGHSVKR